MIRIGTAGWSVPSRHAERFAGPGTHLERYARVMNAVEINSSFYRPHKPETYARWAAAVPDAFRFAVKLPKAITHEARLAGAGDLLRRFLAEAGALGAKLGVLLVQLPPKLAFDGTTAGAFFADLRALHAGPIACEPRHAGWFTAEADALLTHHRIARVAADPPAGSSLAADPGGWRGLVYCRLHGSPRIYYSAYPAETLGQVARRLSDAPDEAWCIFDNTAGFEALGDALTTMAMLPNDERAA